MAQKRYGIAKQIFDIQNQQGGVPSHVLAAARRLIAGGDSVTDAALCFNYLGIRKTGASVLRKNASAARSVLAPFGAYSNFAGTISQGGLPAVGAGLGMVDRASADVVSILKSKMLQQALTKALVPLLKQKDGAVAVALREAISTLTGGDTITGGAQATRKLLYGARGAARYVGALATSAATIAAFAYFGSSAGNTLGSLMTGNVNVEARRQLQQETNLALSDSLLSAGRKRLAGWNYLSRSHRLHGLGATPVVGEYFARRLDSMQGFDARSKGVLETSLDLHESRLGTLSPVQLRELAAGRYFRGKSFTTTGARLEEGYENLDRNAIGAAIRAAVKAATGQSIKFRPGEEAQAGVTAEAQKALKRGAELRARFEDQVWQRRFSDAKETARQANEELPGTVTKKFALHPENAYRAYESSRVSNRMWVISNSPRSGARDWDH